MDEQIISEKTIVDKVIDAGSGFGNLGDPGNFKMPSIEDVMKLIDQMQDITEEEREDLKSNLMFPDPNAADKLRQQFEAAANANARPSSTDYILFLAMLGLIALVFALFGYKLYKSLMEKKQKKQEKQKNNKKAKKIKQK